MRRDIHEAVYQGESTMKTLNLSLLFLSLVSGMTVPGVAADRHAADLPAYEAVSFPLIGTSITGMPVHLSAKSGYFGLQYGPGKDEVAYIALDYSADKGTYETLDVYASKDSRYAVPFRVKGSRRRGRAVIFRSFNLKTSFGEVDAEYDVELTADGTTVELLAVCTLTDDKRSICRFALAGPIDPGMGTGRPAEVLRLLALPEIICALDHRSSPPKLSGSLKMGKWAMLPENKMSCRVTATLTSEDGKKAVRERATLDEMDRGRFRFSPTRRMISGQIYNAEVSVDLGSFFGVLNLVKSLVPRKI